MFLIGAADHDLVVLIGMAHHGLLVDVGWVGVARAKIHHECHIPLHRFPMAKCERRLSSIGGLVRCLLASGFESSLIGLIRLFVFRGIMWNLFVRLDHRFIVYYCWSGIGCWLGHG